ncbi:MAG: isocitrate lyase/phosphoenolpyruvate mutase family protein [Acidobacteria bacterium]|nr:isocitrate lyase/phosphoenolpyruvate mutase family protein [Acidobacteriota bacterium]
MSSTCSADPFDADALDEWMSAPRFKDVRRLYTARQVAEQRGSAPAEYPGTRRTAEAFYARLRELFAARRSMTTFGPYSPGQAVVMKRLGLEGIYLGGWATSAKGSLAEDPGADLASYPLNQVPDEAAAIVRALATADKNQFFSHTRLRRRQAGAPAPADFRPFIIADADTGHGGDAHVRNLIRRFVEAGVPGYHIEDQKPGVKKCGHQGGKVLVSSHEQLQRLNAARFQLDVMGVPGIIVARTDAEAANLLEACDDERDQPFILGVTDLSVPSYRAVVLSVMQHLGEQGIREISGHGMFALSKAERQQTMAWLRQAGLLPQIDAAAELIAGGRPDVDAAFDGLMNAVLDVWQAHAKLMTLGEAVSAALRGSGPKTAGLVPDGEGEGWRLRAGWFEIRERARALGVEVAWDCERAKTPDGYYQVRGGLDYAIAKSLAAAPFADLLWMETATANLDEARAFAGAIHAVFPDKMLAYNLSPSFNWDTTGMTDDEMRRFPEELGALGFVFNFITYGGHQVDGLASEEFVTSLQQDGMLALAKLQRRLRLIESPYRTPQTLVGGPRLDAALMAASGRTATTKAMGKGSTQHQHLQQTEVTPAVLDRWLARCAKDGSLPGGLRSELRPVSAGSDVLRLRVRTPAGATAAGLIYSEQPDRHGRRILWIHEEIAAGSSAPDALALTLAHLFAIQRGQASVELYASPTAENLRQIRVMKDAGIVAHADEQSGSVLVATVNAGRVAELVKDEGVALLQRAQPA